MTSYTFKAILFVSKYIIGLSYIKITQKKTSSQYSFCFISYVKCKYVVVVESEDNMWCSEFTIYATIEFMLVLDSRLECEELTLYHFGWSAWFCLHEIFNKTFQMWLWSVLYHRRCHGRNDKHFKAQHEHNNNKTLNYKRGAIGMKDKLNLCLSHSGSF